MSRTINGSRIGIFDSGVGGLTVHRALRKELPGAELIYLGDTARVPYGTRSSETIRRFCAECADFFSNRKIDCLVVACNTASAQALDIFEDCLQMPVFGMIDVGADAALEAIAEISSPKVLVLGTNGTVRSRAYSYALSLRHPTITVVERACPLFVPLAEEGWGKGNIAELVAERYLGEFAHQGVDVAILGCTHYPLLEAAIRSALGGNVTVVDGASAMARQVKSCIARGRASSTSGRESFFVTDSPERFRAAAQSFLGADLLFVEQVQLSDGSLRSSSPTAELVNR